MSSRSEISLTFPKPQHGSLNVPKPADFPPDSKATASQAPSDTRDIQTSYRLKHGRDTKTQETCPAPDPLQPVRIALSGYAAHFLCFLA